MPSPASAAGYYVPRRFVPNSKLHWYLSLKTPLTFGTSRRDYNLYEVTFPNVHIALKDGPVKRATFKRHVSKFLKIFKSFKISSF